jgi:hypothetical protein
MRAPACAALVCALGCARVLDLPSASPLAISPAFASVAPREKLALAATGGAGGYRFAFAQAGRLSGADATIDAAGAYQAGAVGSAQDVVSVTDAAGVVREARISVTQRLAIAPLQASIAPGGHVPFSATGGKPPYSFSLESSAGDASIDPAGRLFAGTAGDVSLAVAVRDATLDAAASSRGDVAVTSALRLFAPGKDSLAPYGVIELIATGGQQPYAYSMTGDSGGSVDAQSGRYQAGPGGGADMATVTDAFAQTASQALQPGPPLSARLESADIHPGQVVRVLASGGKPPYSFRLAPRGNHSLATVDAITGDYLPGGNFAAVDTIEVRDSTPGQLAVAPVTTPPVGALRIPQCRGMRTLAADLNGDKRKDIVCLDQFRNTVSGWILDPETGPRVSSTSFRFNPIQVAAADLDGNNTDDLVVLTSNELWFIRTNVDGSLGESIFGAIRPSTTIPSSLLASQPGSASFFYVEENGPPCGAGQAGIARLDWSRVTLSVTGAVCVVTLGPPPFPIMGLVAADFDGDGQTDLAWVAAADPGTLHFRYGPSFAALGTDADAFALGPGLFLASPFPTSSIDTSHGVLMAGPWSTTQPFNPPLRPAGAHRGRGLRRAAGGPGAAQRGADAGSRRSLRAVAGRHAGSGHRRPFHRRRPGHRSRGAPIRGLVVLASGAHRIRSGAASACPTRPAPGFPHL